MRRIFCTNHYFSASADNGWTVEEFVEGQWRYRIGEVVEARFTPPPAVEEEPPPEEAPAEPVEEHPVLTYGMDAPVEEEKAANIRQVDEIWWQGYVTERIIEELEPEGKCDGYVVSAPEGTANEVMWHTTVYPVRGEIRLPSPWQGLDDAFWKREGEGEKEHWERKEPPEATGTTEGTEAARTWTLPKYLCTEAGTPFWHNAETGVTEWERNCKNADDVCLVGCRENGKVCTCQGRAARNLVAAQEPAPERSISTLPSRWPSASGPSEPSEPSESDPV